MKDLGKKKLLAIACGMIVIVLLIIIILLIYHAVTGNKTSYKDIETNVTNAAKKYYADNEKLLPQNENEQVTTTDSALTDAGYLKSIKDSNCSAQVIVSNSNGNYRYTTLLNCGENYTSKTFISHIKGSVSKVTSGDGLYDLNGELVYRGEFPDNYVKFSNHLYRIVKISNNNVVLILNEKLDSAVWDDRYNIARDYQDGINDYTVSRIKDYLQKLYDKNTLFNNNDKGLLAKHTLYIGKRGLEDKQNDGSIEKSKTLENQYIGLLPLYDYINASIDTNCLSANDYSCSNYNYLNYYNYYWWTITADSSTTHRVYRVSSDGEIGSSTASSNGYLRPVIYLASDALYAGGTGTESNPYIVK